MFCLLILEIVPFAERNDNILKQIENQYEIFSSGSIGQYYDGKCNPTLPEHSVDSVTRKSDWCSNVNKSSSDHPWLVLHIPHKSIKLSGYALRTGCCYYDCCCINDNQYVYCCCALFSWSVQGSHDNKTWTTIHKITKDKDLHYCSNRFFDTNTEESYEYIRLIQDEPWPGCPMCICINKFEIYGSTTESHTLYFHEENEDSVSIIGKLRQ